MKTPIAFLIFNRPDTTRQVFTEIARARPSTLLVVADGPRSTRPGEDERCAAARSVIEAVDWDCRVLTNFSAQNMGCKRRVSSGLDWVFDTVPEAIILEDDCLPHPTFFPYCEALLQEYRYDQRIMAVSGDNFQFGRKRTGYSYYFSRYNHVWGWATWARAWDHYDVDMSLWPEIRDGEWLRDIFGNDRQAAYWRTIFEQVYQGRIDTWDYQWTFACWLHNALTILPEVNLIANIGFGAEATHTRSDSVFANLAVDEMRFPLRRPPFLIRDAKADAFTAQRMFQRSLVRRLAARVRNVLR